MKYLDLTGDILHVHDPTVVKTKFGWRCFSTNGGIGVRASDDLKAWRLVRPVFAEVPKWAAERGARDAWAPEVVFLNGQWQLFYSVSRFGSQVSGIGRAVCESDDPGDAKAVWRDTGPVILSERGDPYNAIDAAISTARDGSVRMVFGSFWKGIFSVRLDPKTLKTDGKPVQIATNPSTAIEGAYVFERGGWWWMLVSHDFCCRGADSTYNQVVGRSKSPDGPFLGRDGKRLLDGGGWQITRPLGRWRGPGHGMVVRDGRKDYLVHHAYDTESRGAPTLRIAELRWKGGWPIAQDEPARTFSDVVGAWEHRAGAGAASMVNLLPGGKLNREAGPETWALTGDTLTLRWPNADAPGGAWVDTLTVAADRRSYKGANQGGQAIVGRRVA